MGQVSGGQAGGTRGAGAVPPRRSGWEGPVCPWSGQAGGGLAVTRLGEDLEGQARGTYPSCPSRGLRGGSVMMAEADVGPAHARHQRAVNSYGETGAPPSPGPPVSARGGF